MELTMFLGSYRFVGDPQHLLPAYDRLMAGVPTGALSLHVCVSDQHGITVIDACPTREIFVSFSGGEEWGTAIAESGLPTPTVTLLGTVHTARLFDKVVS